MSKTNYQKNLQKKACPPLFPKQNKLTNNKNSLNVAHENNKTKSIDKTKSKSNRNH